MSQTPIALSTTLAHKPFAWRRWLMILIVATLLSGGLWWAKETGRLDSLLTSSTAANTTLNASTPGETISTGQQPTGLVPATSDTTAALQSPDVVNAATADITDRATQPATTAAAATEAAADKSMAEVVTVSRSLVAVAGIEGVQVWDATGQLLTTLDIGAKLQATARTADSQWLTVKADNTSGWAKATQVVAFDLADLPVTTLAAPVTTASSQTVVATEATSTAVETTQSTGETETQAPVATTPRETAVQPVSAAVAAVVVTNGANLNVRSGPSISAALVTKIANGATVTIIGRDENSAWVQIQLSTSDADTGWVAPQYLQLDSALDTLPVVTSVPN